MKVSACLAVFCLIISVIQTDARRGGRPSKRGRPSSGGKPSFGGKPSYGGKPGGRPAPAPVPAPAAPGSDSCTCDAAAIKAEVLAEVATTIATLTRQLDTTTATIRTISEPDVFSCKRMSGYSDESAPIPYTACDVENPSGLVGLDSGKFTVQRDGVYRLTFTARMSSMDGKVIRAEMFVNDVIIGRSWAGLDSSDTTTVLDLETTSTLDQLYELKSGDEVYMMLNYVGTTNLIQSSSNYQIFFTGEWIRDL